MEPQIRFCTSSDGTRIAYATLGEGPALVLVPPWGGDLERDWEHPESGGFLEGLSQGRQLVIFDRRGVGASQREVDDFSLQAQVADLAAVVASLQLEQFHLWGMLDGTAISVAYAVEHPQRIGRLALWSAYDCGVEIVRPGTARGFMELIRGNWSLARRAIADVMFPSGPTELRQWFADSFRRIVAPEVAAKQVEFYATVDLRPLLPQVVAPTLVLHRRGNRDAPISAGRAAAALIPDARFVALEGDSDHPFMGDVSHVDILTNFLDEGRGGTPAAEVSAPVRLEAGDVHTILFTDIEGSTALTQRLGDAKAQELVRTHNGIVRDALQAYGGTEIKHTGDGIMASFPSASGALECAIAVERGVAERSETPLGVRIGLNAGEPMEEEKDLFGTAVQLARRICDRAAPGEIMASDVVRQLAAGKGFLFSDRGDVELRGFEDPVRLHEVRWVDDG